MRLFCSLLCVFVLFLFSFQTFFFARPIFEQTFSNFKLLRPGTDTLAYIDIPFPVYADPELLLWGG